MRFAGSFGYRPFTWAFSATFAAAAVLLGSSQADQELFPDQGRGKTYEVQITRNVPYYEGPDADKTKHRLDLYLPKGRTDFPVVFFVHGGAWIHGDKNFFGRHEKTGLFWAKHGVGVVAINYRLSPEVLHPKHIQDVARAFAWTYKNIRKYQGRPDQIFVFGHSAGGHLVALLATDDRYLKAEGLGLQNIKGVIAMSGVYRIPEDNPVFDRIFGKDAKARQAASPLFHVNPACPPFLILYALHDLFFCGKKPAQEFCQALRDKKVNARAIEIKGRNHATIYFYAHSENDPAVRAMDEFIRTQTQQKKVASK